MSGERRAAVFGDLRGWIGALRAAGELREVSGEVDWNIELGTILRLAQGPGTVMKVLGALGVQLVAKPKAA